MRLPDIQAAFTHAPGNLQFHRAVVEAVLAFERDNDLSYEAIRERTAPAAKEKYGYGAAHLAPYGYYHPTQILPMLTKEFSRGRLVQKLRAGQPPKYVYSYGGDGQPVAIEFCGMDPEYGPNPECIIFILPTEDADSPLMLGYLTRDRGNLPRKLSYIAWRVARGDCRYIFYAHGYGDASPMRVDVCVTEIIEPYKDRMLYARHEYYATPGIPDDRRLHSSSFECKNEELF